MEQVRMNDENRTAMKGQRLQSGREKHINVMVGQNLKTLRAMAGMSQAILAERLGITFQQVQKYEAGTNRVSAPKLALMAEIFNTPIATFFSNTGLDEEVGSLPMFGRQALRAARLVEGMRPQLQSVAIRVLKSIGEETQG